MTVSVTVSSHLLILRYFLSILMKCTAGVPGENDLQQFAFRSAAALIIYLLCHLIPTYCQPLRLYVIAFDSAHHSVNNLFSTSSYCVSFLRITGSWTSYAVTSLMLYNGRSSASREIPASNTGSAIGPALYMAEAADLKTRAWFLYNNN